MKTVHLYRYPHPVVPDRFIYVGQGSKRDKEHRAARTPFGRRYKKTFPETDLTYPIRWEEPASNQLEANICEEAAISRFCTWRKKGGMNWTSPRSDDYQNMGRLGGSVTRDRKVGIYGLTPEQRSEIGRKMGCICKETKMGIFSLTQEQRIDNARRAGIFSAQKRGYKDCAQRARILGIKNARNSGFLSGISRLVSHDNRVRVGQIGGLKGSNITNCLRWNIRRGKPCACGKHMESR
jgi:hypothetical protein